MLKRERERIGFVANFTIHSNVSSIKKIERARLVKFGSWSPLLFFMLGNVAVLFFFL